MNTDWEWIKDLAKHENWYLDTPEDKSRLEAFLKTKEGADSLRDFFMHSLGDPDTGSYLLNGFIKSRKEE